MVQKNRHMSKKIDITSLYLSDYNLYFSGREIGRLVKINHQTAMNLLKQLVKEKVLTIVKKGRSNLYYLNLDSFECTYYLQIAEIVKARNALSNVELKLVIEKIVSLCETVIVFGSFSSGKQKNSSDIDLVVVSPRSKVKIQDEIKIFPREINIEYPFLGYRKNKFSSEINHYVSKKRKFASTLSNLVNNNKFTIGLLNPSINFFELSKMLFREKINFCFPKSSSIKISNFSNQIQIIEDIFSRIWKNYELGDKYLQFIKAFI